MKKILLILLMCFILCGCESKSELDKIIEEDNYIIVDVRSGNEFRKSHVVDAVNIPYDEINSDIGLDKDKTVLVYCMSGNRSGIAYDILTDLGYEVYDLGAFSEIHLPKE